MEFPETEIAEIKKFMDSLNSQTNCVVVVEGKRDAAALVKLGYSGKILEFHRFNGMIKFADSAAKYRKLILLKPKEHIRCVLYQICFLDI